MNVFRSFFAFRLETHVRCTKPMRNWSRRGNYFGTADAVWMHGYLRFHPGTWMWNEEFTCLSADYKIPIQLICLNSAPVHPTFLTHCSPFTPQRTGEGRHLHGHVIFRRCLFVRDGNKFHAHHFWLNFPPSFVYCICASNSTCIKCTGYIHVYLRLYDNTYYCNWSTVKTVSKRLWTECL